MARIVTTRFLIISDTHGRPLHYAPKEKVDVVIHCGDLTEQSNLSELHTTINLLKGIDAPLKLVIAGNHDWTLDTPAFKRKLEEARLDINDETVKRTFGTYGEVQALLESENAKASGIVYLQEGTHRVKLHNGAHLTVYASPCTPSVDGWAFNYDPKTEHDWQIGSDVDIAITHCPPHGLLDRSATGKRCGSPSLFAAVARARPQMHCFGHMHRNWGAKEGYMARREGERGAGSFHGYRQRSICYRGDFGNTGRGEAGAELEGC